jgi:hypothetical protein
MKRKRVHCQSAAVRVEPRCAQLSCAFGFIVGIRVGVS